MKIGVDIKSAVGKKAGIGYYTEGIVKALSKIDKENQYYLYTTERVDWKLGSNFHQIVLETNNLFKKFLWYLSVWIDIFIKNKIDKFWSPNSLTIPALSFLKPKVYLSVLDLVPYKMKKTAEIKVRLLFLQLPIAIKFSKHILALSEATKQDLIKYLKVPESKMTVTHAAAQAWCFGKTTKNEIQKIKEKYNLPEKYFLFVSTLEPRKNIPNLIKAFSIFSKKNTQDIKLVIGGKKGWLYDEIYEVVKSEEMENKVIFTDYIPEEDMLGLYKGAFAFTFVPYMEGFGLSPLEAITCGVPVITTNTSSLPEVVGEAAIKVGPEDIGEIAEAMERIATDEKLRNDLIRKGLKQAKKFSWEKTARIVLDVLMNK